MRSDRALTPTYSARGTPELELSYARALQRHGASQSGLYMIAYVRRVRREIYLTTPLDYAMQASSKLNVDTVTRPKLPSMMALSPGPFLKFQCQSNRKRFKLRRVRVCQ